MRDPRFRLPFAAAVIMAVAAVGLAAASPSRSEEVLSLSELARATHIHGIAVDPEDRTRLRLATHHGFFLALPDGTARRISESRDDFMGFTPHPTDPSILYASGHPAQGGNLGFVVSRDGGRTWTQLASGVAGPVDFHQLDVSGADPQVIYGAYRGLQRSRNGGRDWERVGPQPDGLIALAASTRDPERLYAATEDGLLVSDDGGVSWRAAFLLRRPASLVQAAPDGRIYAFVLGVGLIRADEPRLDWATVSRDFGDRLLLHLAVDPVDGDRLHAVTQHGELLASGDAGQTWGPFGAR